MRWFILLPLFLLHFGAYSAEDLRAIIKKYGNTDKDSVHSYIEPYERLLSPFKNKPCNLLEIGVQFGGSAIMWHDYLPQSQLYLLDVRDAIMHRIAKSMQPNRWHFYVTDAYSLEMVSTMQQECPKGFDIIIDDGPHTLESQIFVLTSYLPLLNKGGVLIIEDIQQFYHVAVLKKYVPLSSEFQIEVIDLRNKKGRYDDVLFVVKRA